MKLSKKDLELLRIGLDCLIQLNRQEGISDHSEESQRCFEMKWELDRQWREFVNGGELVPKETPKFSSYSANL